MKQPLELAWAVLTVLALLMVSELTAVVAAPSAAEPDHSLGLLFGALLAAAGLVGQLIRSMKSRAGERPPAEPPLRSAEVTPRQRRLRRTRAVGCTASGR
jgi:hypothetical protein